ncbi:MAG: hypothetical protein ACREEM_54620, partial [Blastocatellia bacterium]
MDETIKFELTKSEAEQLSAMLDDVIAAVDESLKRMAKGQEEISRYNAKMHERLNRDWRGGVNVETILRPVSPGFDFTSSSFELSDRSGRRHRAGNN